MINLPVFMSFGLFLAALGGPVPHRLTPAESASAQADKLLRANKYQEALDAYTEAVTLDPAYSNAYLSRVSARNGLHQSAGVEADYELAIRTAPRSAKPLIARGSARYYAERPAEAISDLNAAILLNPFDDEPFFLRGCSRLLLGQLESAVADLSRALELERYDGNSLVNCYVNRASALRSLGQPADALADYNRAKIAGYDDAAGRANCLADLKRFDEAILIYNDLLPPLQPGAEPNDQRIDLLIARGLARMGRKENEEAAADLAAAVAQKPDRANTYGSLAWVHLLAHQPVEARVAAQKGLDLDGSQEWIRVNLANAYLMEGNLEEAKKIYLGYVNRWYSPDKTGLQAVKDEFAALRAAGIAPPETATIEAMLPEHVDLPPAPPRPRSEPGSIKQFFYAPNPQR